MEVASLAGLASGCSGALVGKHALPGSCGFDLDSSGVQGQTRSSSGGTLLVTAIVLFLAVCRYSPVTNMCDASGKHSDSTPIGLRGERATYDSYRPSTYQGRQICSWDLHII